MRTQTKDRTERDALWQAIGTCKQSCWLTFRSMATVVHTATVKNSDMRKVGNMWNPAGETGCESTVKH